MTWFISIALIFSVLLLLAVIFDGVFDVVDLDFGGDGLLSATTLSAALAGAGYAGWIAIAGFGASEGVAVLAAGAAAVTIGLVTAKTVRLIKGAETRNARTEDKIGATGTAVTGAAAGSPFEFSLYHGGHPVKIGAIAEHDVAPGEALVVDQVLSPTRVKVRRASAEG